MSIGMSIGQMRYRVNLLQPSTVRDTFGGRSNPVAFATTYAKIEALQGKELYKAQEMVAEVSHRVTIRYQPGVVTKYLVDFKGRIFSIEAIINVEERNRFLQLLCLERNDGTRQQAALFLASGQITNGAGATVVFSGGPSGVTVTADAQGNFSALLLNGTYTVTPTRSGHTITPANATVTVADSPVTGINFTAS